MLKATIISIFLLMASVSYATDIHIFYGQGCPHCAAANDFLDSLDYPVTIHKHETYFNQTERELLQKMTSAYGTEINGVPMIFINQKVFTGFSNTVAGNIESEIVRCLSEECIDPETKIGNGNIVNELTVPAVLLAATVDAINPCAFAVLIILVSTILVTKKKCRALFAGLAFSLSIFISYFLMGLGLYSAIHASGMTHIFFFVVAILAIIMGLFNLKDYFWYGKWFVTEVPFKWRPRLKSLLKNVTSVPGAFLIGFLVSLFLLPCTSGPYIIILGLLAETTTKSYAMMLLLLYNLVFVLPMILITLALYFGLTTTEKAEEIRQKRLKTLHLISGLIILCLGIGMLIVLYTGTL